MQGMVQAAKLHKIVAVHAEDDRLTAELARQAIMQSRTGIRDYLASRPIAAELAAIKRAIRIAEETGCALHIVHVSCGSGVALVAEARARGIDISCETCPHYLILTEEDVEQLGAVAKCAPPLRSHAEQVLLWEQLLAGNIQFIASDHSPAPAWMKTSENFFQVWGGIAGCQSLLQLLLTEWEHGRGQAHAPTNLPLPTGRGQAHAIRRDIAFSSLALLTSEAIARRFHIPQKGSLAIGNDADLALVNLQASITLEASDLYYRHAHSPYIGRILQGQIVRTLVRGVTVYKDGQFSTTARGQLLTPI